MIKLYLFSCIGMAAEIQPSDWLWGQILLLPHVPGCGLHGVEAVFRSGSIKQVRQLLRVKPALKKPMSSHFYWTWAHIQHILLYRRKVVLKSIIQDIGLCDHIKSSFGSKDRNVARSQVIVYCSKTNTLWNYLLSGFDRFVLDADKSVHYHFSDNTDQHAV